jgi:endoglucanase
MSKESTLFRLGVTALASVAALIMQAAISHAALTYTGVNLAGADFGESHLPGTYNVDYTYPTAAEVDYFVEKGVNTFRIPFRWERLQQTQNGAFNATELGRLTTIVNYATSQGANVILDPHNYARYGNGVIGSVGVPNSSFSDFWTKLSNVFKDDDHVIFGLVNEPHDLPTEQWESAAQDAINAIRDTGATNMILVPGNAWTGAEAWTQNWYGTPNATAMLNITDPGDNFAFEVHQYLDPNNSGQPQIVSPTIGVERLTNFTQWLHDNNRKGFLGEFAAANSLIGTGGTQIGDEAISNMLNYMQDNSDAWLGFTWWAAGPWWGNYQFTMEPTNLGQPSQADRPSMTLIQPYLAGIDQGLDGDFNGDGTVDAADYTEWRDHFGDPYTEDDFLLWRDHFGETSPGAGSGSSAVAGQAVPEPTSIALLLVAVGGLAMFRIRLSATPVV